MSVVTEPIQPRVKDAWCPTGRTERTQSYYLVRKSSHDYASYWGDVTDPDGQQRNRLSAAERERYIADTKDEIDFVSRLSPCKVLDFGCGPGWFLAALPEGFRKYGYDPHLDPKAEDEAKRHCLLLNSTAYIAAERPFGVLICHHVIEHCVDPVGVLRMLRACLAPGGHLIMATPDFHSPCAVQFGHRYRLLHDQTHCSLFTRESMSRFLRDHGFEINDLRFPFPERYATTENFARWNDKAGVSPPWPGNFMTFYCTRQVS